MGDVLTFVVIGIANGAVYAIAGIGLVLTYRTSGVFNFAHGAQAASAAYVMYTLREQAGLPWPLAAVGAVLVAGVLGGLLLERLAHLLATERPATRVVATVGLLVGLQSLLTVVYGAATLQFAPFLPTSRVRVLDVNIGIDQLLVTVIAILATVALAWLFRRTRLGTAMQAVVDDPDLLDVRGTSPVAVRRWAWLIGSGYASVSGLLLATFVGLDATILTLLVLFSFGAAAVGRFHSITATFAGGLLIGVGQALAQRYLGQVDGLQQLPANVPFLVLVAMLLVWSRRGFVDRGARALRPPDLPRRVAAPVSVTAALLALGGLAVVPFVVGGRLPVWSTALGYAIVFLSLGLLVRTSGQVSLCHVTFAAVGAATFANAVGAGVPWLVAIALAAAAAAVVGVLVAVPAIRLQGIHLAIITFGFGLLVQRLFYGSFLMFGGTVNRPAPRPSLGPLDLTSDRAYYFVVLLFAVGVAALVALVLRSRLGLLLRGLSESPDALSSHGVNTSTTKLLVFAIAAGLAGLGGAVIAPVTRAASSAAFESTVSLVLLAVLFVAGRSAVASAFVAAGLYVVAVNYLGDGVREYSGLAFGTAALLVATRTPERLLSLLAGSRRGARRRRLLPARDAVLTAPRLAEVES